MPLTVPGTFNMLTQHGESEKVLKLWAQMGLVLGMATTVSKGEVTWKANILILFLLLILTV